MITVNSTLTVLHLYENDLVDQDATKLADSLARNFTFKELYLNENGTGAAGGSKLAELLIVSSKLRALDLTQIALLFSDDEEVSDELQLSH